MIRGGSGAGEGGNAEGDGERRVASPVSLRSRACSPGVLKAEAQSVKRHNETNDSSLLMIGEVC